MESQIWSAIYELEYEAEANIAWEGLTQALADRLINFAPFISADGTTNTLQAVLGARAVHRADARAQFDLVLDNIVDLSDPKPQSIRLKRLYSAEDIAFLTDALNSNEIMTHQLARISKGANTPGFPARIEIIDGQTPPADILPLGTKRTNITES